MTFPLKNSVQYYYRFQYFVLRSHWCLKDFQKCWFLSYSEVKFLHPEAILWTSVSGCPVSNVKSYHWPVTLMWKLAPKAMLRSRQEEPVFPTLHSGLAKQEKNSPHSLLPNFFDLQRDTSATRMVVCRCGFTWRQGKSLRFRLGYRLREPSRSCKYKRISQSPRSPWRFARHWRKVGGKAVGPFICYKEGCCCWKQKLISSWVPKHLHRKRQNLTCLSPTTFLG